MNAEMDRISSGLLRLVKGYLARTDYHALYPCTVISQNGDGTLELQADTEHVKVPSKVPIMLGLPGATVTLQAGATVLLGFVGGDPKRPRAMLWGESIITELVLNGGAVGLAKADHTHNYSLLSVGGAPTNATGTPSSNTNLLKVP